MESNNASTDTAPEKCKKCRHKDKRSCNRCQYRDERHRPNHDNCCAAHHRHHPHKLGNIAFAVILILAGIIMLGHNLTFIDDYVYNIVMSWPMILIVTGIISLYRRKLTAGLILLTIGTYFLLFRIIGIEGSPIRLYWWPVMLVVIGLILIFRNRKHHRARLWHGWSAHHRHADTKEKVDDGFVTLGVSFGSTKTIVMDPVFRGADIDVSFGSVSLDLKRTVLEAPETYINIDISFGGAELRIPSSWYVVTQSNNSFGGCEDKRWVSGDIDYDHKLIIRGTLSFSGIEIKD